MPAIRKFSFNYLKTAWDFLTFHIFLNTLFKEILVLSTSFNRSVRLYQVLVPNG